MAKSRRKIDKSQKILVSRDPSFASCPSCDAPFTLRRSRARNIFETAIRSMTFFKIYRCRDCGWRGFKSTKIITVRSLKNIVLFMAVTIVSVYIVMKVIEANIN